jgi:hypothetical protein
MNKTFLPVVTGLTTLSLLSAPAIAESNMNKTSYNPNAVERSVDTEQPHDREINICDAARGSVVLNIQNETITNCFDPDAPVEGKIKGDVVFHPGNYRIEKMGDSEVMSCFSDKGNLIQFRSNYIKYNNGMIISEGFNQNCNPERNQIFVSKETMKSLQLLRSANARVLVEEDDFSQIK